MYAQANMGHPSRTNNLGGEFKTAYAALLHPLGFTIRRVEAGFFNSLATGRIGRWTKLPPQLGHTPPNIPSEYFVQNVHS
jgi:hypothetical protein